MALFQSLARRRSRAVWTDPVRRYRTLQSFSETEADGGRDILLAARRVTDPELRLHLERHAVDERRHADLFRRRAAQVRALAADAGTTEAEVSDKAVDLDEARKGAELDFDAHGTFTADVCDESGEVAYVAMLHVAEMKAAEVFRMHSELNAHDPDTKAIFDEILKDEKYHVAYTGKFLEQWRREGRGVEVDKCLKSARSSRFIGAWKRLGIRSGAGFSRVLLLVMYWTVLAPFGLIARSGKRATGWRPARDTGTSQY